MTPEYATAFRDHMVQGLAGEMATTRRVLDAVPQERSDYKPDEKAKSGAELAWHLASTEVQMTEEIADMKFGMEPRYEAPATVAEIGPWYTEKMTAALDRVRAMTAEQLMTPVDFYGAFNFPAFMYLSFVEKHSTHHRGQLSAYLRPMGSKVPSIYGGSADEPWQGAADSADAAAASGE